jgi:hypothetical protein
VDQGGLRVDRGGGRLGPERRSHEKLLQGDTAGQQEEIDVLHLDGPPQRGARLSLDDARQDGGERHPQGEQRDQNSENDLPASGHEFSPVMSEDWWK